MKTTVLKIGAWLPVALAILAPAPARGMDEDEGQSTAVAGAAESASDAESGAHGQMGNKLIIRDIESSNGMKNAKPVTWLGVSVSETTDALASQLGLKPGEGLVVSYVCPDSPAAKAAVLANDVLVDLDGQMLVHPIQLRKLLQMHAEGETVKLTFFRSGKKQTLPATLGLTTWKEASSMDRETAAGRLENLELELKGLNEATSTLGNKMKDVAISVVNSTPDREQLNSDVREAIEEARKALTDAMRESAHARRAPHAFGTDLQELAGGGMDIGKDATVVIKTDRNSVRTMVESDDDGSYVLTAGPRKHLTAHDKDGKLLFDGDIETAKQQKQVPAKVWEKVKPMLDQLASDTPGRPDDKK